jgi:two-component system chemotaxis response regulator CheB
MDTENGRAKAVVAVAASAGGVEALTNFVGHLPPDFGAVTLVVLHLPPGGPSVLPSILARAAKLPVVHAEAGLPLRPGVVIVAPPGHHLVVRDHQTDLIRGPRENGHRPSADALFRSAALAYGDRSAGVVLSGTMDDGAAGLRAIGLADGLTIAQEPSEAAFPGMPRAAIAEAHPSIVCRVADMAEHLVTWMSKLPTDDAIDEPSEADQTMSYSEHALRNELSEFTCPECGGTLWLDNSMGAERFRCRVGHTFSFRGLQVGKQEALEAALWAAIVALQERADLSRRLLKRLEGVGRPSQLQRYRDDVSEAGKQVELLRSLIGELVRPEMLPSDGDDDVHAAR